MADRGVGGSLVTVCDASRPDAKLMEELHKVQPWKSSPRYFRNVKVSALAALQMLNHAKRGRPNVARTGPLSAVSSSLNPGSGEPQHENWFEVLGLLLGHFRENELIVNSAFALPVDASEVECSMNEASQMYMLNYLQYHQRASAPVRPQEGVDEEGGGELGPRAEAECCVGWYHSHPGYTCFLSGTDVATQRIGQAVQDPWVAIVIDPVRTMATGKLDMRAFRTFPERFVGEQCDQGEDGTVKLAAVGTGSVAQTDVEDAEEHPATPASRVREYGAHACCYYELPIALVCSRADDAQLNGLRARSLSKVLSTDSSLTSHQARAQQIHQITSFLKANTVERLRKNTVDGVLSSQRSGLCRSGEDNGVGSAETQLTDLQQMNSLMKSLVQEAATSWAINTVKDSVFKMC
uniref:Putative metallopeptidase n=1 Tax=Trypanosoma congolense (strain IL3000) TaxID=1068625 RepID=G0USE9_TRYCI|nr:putative metallopeptidase [Trypanosoma congolense IL3000]